MAGKTKRRGAQERHDNPQPSEARSQPYAAAEFTAKAQNLEALRSAVVDSAGIGASLWFSYLFALFYLLIAVGSVTHRELLLETPVKLPFLGIELPFVGFFVLGPLLFLIVHAYMLLHLVLLASRVGAFHTELHKQIADDAVRARLRRQLPSNVFVQFLAGPFEVRTGIIGFMLRLIAYISLIVGPLALLVFFQLQFLPYHHSWVTWWHRLIILADLVLIWMLWPSVVRGSTNWIAWQDLRRGNVAMAVLASLTTLSLVFAIATYPGETFNERLPSIRWIPTYHADEREQRAGVVAALLQSIKWKSLHEILVAGDVDYLANKPTSIWSNRLVLPGFDLIERAKPSDSDVARRETLSLRGRQLEGAVLIGARLRNVDFTGAQLRGANLVAADLRDANFGCVDGWDGKCADLREAKLGSAELQGASLIGANLQGAELNGSGLQGVSLYAAKLQGASLKWARLQGASLADAHLQGATLAGAYLQGATLAGAKLQGADLEGAYLQGASLEGTVLWGASLEIAKLQGASLVRTELQGATLLGAWLRDASLDHAYLWRTNPTDMNDDVVVNEAVQMMIIAPFTGASYEAGCPGGPPCFWMDSDFAELKQMIENQVPVGRLRDRALRRIAVLDPSASDQKADEARAGAWSVVTTRALSPDQYQPLLAKLLEEIGCNPQGAPHVISRITSYLDMKSLSFRFTNESPHPARVASTFLNEERCSSARKLSEESKDALRQIRDQASQPPPVKMPPETNPQKFRPGGLKKKAQVRFIPDRLES